MKRQKAPDTKLRQTANSAWLWLAFKLSFPLPYWTSHWITFFMFCPACPGQPFSFTGHICFHKLHEAIMEQLELASMLLSPDWYKQLQWTLLPNLSHLPDSEMGWLQRKQGQTLWAVGPQITKALPGAALYVRFLCHLTTSLPSLWPDRHEQLGTSGLNTDYFIFFVKETLYCIAFYSENKLTYTCIHKYIWQFESSIPQDFR